MAASSYKRSCFACRIMRAMAFSGIGAAVGALAVYLFDGTRENAMIAAVVMAAVFVFAFTEKIKK